jgi:hypothetical protein
MVFMILAVLFLRAFAGGLQAAEPLDLDAKKHRPGPICISGIYPHLAVFNGRFDPVKQTWLGSGGECGIGAIVPWAGKLRLITYPPHVTRGGADKLWSIDEKLNLEFAPESVGGTHAGRMIHRESNQLVIGPYFIDAAGKVRACDVKKELVGRMTAVARHLTDPKNMVYLIDMEGAVYEVNVNTLAVKRLFKKPVPGDHAKGGYTAQGRLVIANNGERRPKRSKPGQYGVLAEWDGKEWRIVERKQFCDVTGPNGIYGGKDDKAPLWAIGWDRKSVILKLLDGGKWSTFRMPKASHAFDPKHGWYTEWPRIRRIAKDELMMDMHGMFYDFPKGFSAVNTGGIKPIASHLRYIPDFCEWNGRLVLAGDDTSIIQNPLAGKAQSNLWFGKVDDLKNFGPASAWSGVWMGDAVKSDTPSVPFLISGFAKRVVHLTADAQVVFTLEIDVKGDGQWETLKQITVPGGGYKYHIFADDFKANWIRVRTNKDCTATAYFHYASPAKAFGDDKAIFASLPKAADSVGGGLIRPAGHNTNLQLLTAEGTYYEIDEKMNFRIPAKPQAANVKKLAEIKRDFAVDAASVIVTHKGKRYRLPKGAVAYDKLTARGKRECVSERYLFNAHGTFYEIPRDSGAYHPGIELIKPVATHGRSIVDYCTWRGLMVISGARPGVKADGNYFASADGKAGLWFGHIDDLWKLGKPVGVGGPWKDTAVKPGVASDQYLMTGYDRKRLDISHDADQAVEMTVEVNFDHNGWHEYAKISVPAGKTATHKFPDGFNAHWVRLKSSADCKATGIFTYE